MINALSLSREGGDIVAKKGARITWALDNKYIIVSGFSKQSERQIIIYNSKVKVVFKFEGSFYVFGLPAFCPKN